MVQARTSRPVQDATSRQASVTLHCIADLMHDDHRHPQYDQACVDIARALLRQDSGHEYTSSMVLAKLRRVRTPSDRDTRLLAWGMRRWGS